ncbi:DNA-directed RNA polymerase subunit alpha [Phycisphaerae bacterium RAS1]|nr:DNA-directed RNA polymerase subunit alpha [Phycisphaerae bacterium RAS1]
MSVRANNCLEAAAVRTIRELVQWPEQRLLTLRSFGRTSLAEVKEKLAAFGLRVEMTPAEIARWERFGE